MEKRTENKVKEKKRGDIEGEEGEKRGNRRRG